MNETKPPETRGSESGSPKQGGIHNEVDPLREGLGFSEYLRHFAHPDHDNLFILNSGERRITAYSQQVRAFNLVYALCQMVGEPRADKQLVVVGGGMSGVTVAAAAVMKGFRVLLLERNSELLHLQLGNDTRWVHPRIYDWPEPDALTQRAPLPFLGWRAGTAADVAHQILDAFNRLREAYKQRLHVETGVRSVSVHPRGNRFEVHGGAQRYICDYVVLATGFGIERSLPRVPLLSYWRNDPHNQPILHALEAPRDQPERQVRYLISGGGDGGLIDLLRVRLGRLQQDRIVRELFNEERDRTLLGQLRAAKRRIVETRDVQEQSWILQTTYQSIFQSGWISSFMDRLRARLRDDTTATLHVRPEDGTYITNGASMLHTFLTAALDRLKAFEFLSEELVDVAPEAGHWHVTTRSAAGTRTQRTFDYVIVRHGAELAEDSGQGNIRKLCMDARSRRRSGGSILRQDLTGRLFNEMAFDFWFDNTMPHWLKSHQESCRECYNSQGKTIHLEETTIKDLAQTQSFLHVFDADHRIFPWTAGFQLSAFGSDSQGQFAMKVILVDGEVTQENRGWPLVITALSSADGLLTGLAPILFRASTRDAPWEEVSSFWQRDTSLAHPVQLGAAAAQDRSQSLYVLRHDLHPSKWQPGSRLRALVTIYYNKAFDRTSQDHWSLNLHRRVTAGLGRTTYAFLDASAKPIDFSPVYAFDHLSGGPLFYRAPKDYFNEQIADASGLEDTIAFIKRYFSNIAPPAGDTALSMSDLERIQSIIKALSADRLRAFYVNADEDRGILGDRRLLVFAHQP